jgi:hypothetical protein
MGARGSSMRGAELGWQDECHGDVGMGGRNPAAVKRKAFKERKSSSSSSQSRRSSRGSLRALFSRCEKQGSDERFRKQLIPTSSNRALTSSGTRASLRAASKSASETPAQDASGVTAPRQDTAQLVRRIQSAHALCLDRFLVSVSKSLGEEDPVSTSEENVKGAFDSGSESCSDDGCSDGQHKGETAEEKGLVQKSWSNFKRIPGPVGLAVPLPPTKPSLPKKRASTASGQERIQKQMSLPTHMCY